VHKSGTLSTALSLQKRGLFYRRVSDWRMMGTKGVGTERAFRFNLSITFSFGLFFFFQYYGFST
jgi:hypothetical protein